MNQLCLIAIVLNLASVFLFAFFLTGFKISAFRSEERNNSAKGKEKQEYYFHR